MAELIIRTARGNEIVLNPHVDERVVDALSEIPTLERVFGDISSNPAAGFWSSADGRSNSSELMSELCDVVFELLSSGCGSVISESWRSMTARLIVAQLAHVHGMAPLMPRREDHTRVGGPE